MTANWNVVKNSEEDNPNLTSPKLSSIREELTPSKSQLLEAYKRRSQSAGNNSDLVTALIQELEKLLYSLDREEQYLDNWMAIAMDNLNDAKRWMKKCSQLEERSGLTMCGKRKKISSAHLKVL